MLAQESENDFAFGHTPTLADVCLVPQIHNGLATKLDLSDYPNLRRVYRSCLSLSSFQAAAPETQSDTVGKL